MLDDIILLSNSEYGIEFCWYDDKWVGICSKNGIKTDYSPNRLESILLSGISQECISQEYIDGHCLLIKDPKLHKVYMLINGNYSTETRQNIQHIINYNYIEKNYNQIINNIQDGVIIYDNDNNIKWFNLPTLKLLNYTYDELYGKQVTQLNMKYCLSSIIDLNDNLFAMIICQDNDALKRNFISSISHEIRTPLNGIIGMTQLLLQAQDLSKSIDLKESLQIINDCSDQLLKIVNDILDYSKITSGYLKFNREYFSIEECLNRLVKCFSAIIHEKKLNVAIKIENSLPTTIYADQTRVQQILFNLLGNATKFTKIGGNILLRAKSYNSNIIIQVCDNGIGISIDKVEKIFEAFNQFDDTYKCNSHSSTGLGLAISRNLARLMGGDVTVESVINDGSCFTFTFQAEEHTISTNNKIQFKSKILVVDDQINNRLILEKMLRPHCQDLTIVGSSQEVIQLVNKYQYDVIIMDIVMPGINGIELIEMIRSTYALTIALSSISDTVDFSDKFDHVLIKPLQYRDLLEIIQKYEDNQKTILSKNRSILIVEDNHNNATVLSLLLERLDYTNITVVTNGKNAVSEAVENDYDIILMDLKLPIMDGIEACVQILAHKPKSYIIIVSACILEEDRNKCQQVGINNFLAKPININELEDLLSKYHKL